MLKKYIYPKNRNNAMKEKRPKKKKKKGLQISTSL